MELEEMTIPLDGFEVVVKSVGLFQGNTLVWHK